MFGGRAALFCSANVSIAFSRNTRAGQHAAWAGDFRWRSVKATWRRTNMAAAKKSCLYLYI